MRADLHRLLRRCSPRKLSAHPASHLVTTTTTTITAIACALPNPVMASVAEARRSPFSAEPHHQAMHKSIPILPSSTGSSHLTPSRDPMDVTPSTLPTMGPPMLSSPVGDRNVGNQDQQHTNGDTEGKIANGNGMATPVGAAAAAQQPKVVQTAFIHKLYKCAPSIQACASLILMRRQYARRSEHPAPNIVVEHQRELCHVPFKRLLQSPVVRRSGALTAF